MALQNMTAAGSLSRTTGIVSPSSDYSCTFWWLPFARASALARVAFLQRNTAYTNWIAIYGEFNQETLYFWTGSGAGDVSTAAVTCSLNTRCAVAYTRAGTSHRFYINGVLVGGAALTLDVSGFTLNSQWCNGHDTSEVGYAEVQNFREWNAQLSLADLMAEWNSATPVRTSGLVTNTPLSSTYTDTTSNENNWTPTGSLSFSASAVPVANTNTTATSAVICNSTDTYIQVPAESAGVAQDSWWSYTPSAGEVTVGAFAFADVAKTYQPISTLWVGPAASPVAYISTIAANNKAVQFPVTDGTEYFLRARDNVGGVDAALTMSFRSAPDNPAPAGSLLINDDQWPFISAALVSSSGAGVLQYRSPVVPGEAGDVIASSGVVLLENEDDSTLNLYSNQLVLLATLSYPADPTTMLARTLIGGDKWYVGRTTGSGTGVSSVTTVTSAGSFGPTTWTVAPAGGLSALAANAAETILYFTRAGTGLGAVERWDLVNDVALSNLVGAVAGGYRTNDLFVLADGTILVGYQDVSPADFQVRRYSTSGVLLNTYNFGAFATGIPPRMASAIDPGAFWVMWTDGTSQQFQQIRNVRVSDGAILASFSVVVYDRGVYDGVETATPESRFGISNSCPLVILRQPLPPNTTGGGGGGGGAAAAETFIPRRLRRAPHLSDEQRRTRFNSFQLDMETGIGNTVAPGDDPQVMFRWSDDGGHTWSNEHWVGAGRRGVYTWRALWRRLGASRDRVYEVSYSEPTKFNLINAIIEAEEGDS